MNESSMKLRNGTNKAKITRSSSSSSRIRKISKKRIKEKEKEKRCICIPQRYGPVEFPVIWTEFRNNNQLCDGVIICEDGVELKVHRAILSAVSSYFRVILQINSLCIRNQTFSF